jgi:hypothetical protein
MDKDNDEVHKNKARMTATLKRGWSSDTWTSEDLFLAFHFFRSAYLKLRLTVQGR